MWMCFTNRAQLTPTQSMINTVKSFWKKQRLNMLHSASNVKMLWKSKYTKHKKSLCFWSYKNNKLVDKKQHINPVKVYPGIIHNFPFCFILEWPAFFRNTWAAAFLFTPITQKSYSWHLKSKVKKLFSSFANGQPINEKIYAQHNKIFILPIKLLAIILFFLECTNLFRSQKMLMTKCSCFQIFLKIKKMA